MSSPAEEVSKRHEGQKVCTLSGKPPDPEAADLGAPQPINPVTGMHKDYWVLCPDERAKGFVRPLRRSYIHVGKKPQFALRDTLPEERTVHGAEYLYYETYPESMSPLVGRFWTKQELENGCNTNTTMGIALAETYARDPKFYGATFCCSCGKHLPVEEFVWEDGSRVGS